MTVKLIKRSQKTCSTEVIQWLAVGGTGTCTGDDDEAEQEAEELRWVQQDMD